MSRPTKTPELHPGNAVIAKLYSVVVDNENLPELFEAWDQFVEQVFKKDPQEAELWRTLLAEHFEQVGPLIKVSKPSLAEEKQSFIDRQSFPAVLFNSSFRIVAKNEQAHHLWSADLDSDFSNSILPPFKPKRILSMKDRIDNPDPVLISLDIGTDTQPQIAMAVIHPVEFMTGDGVLRETLFILRIAKPSWRDELGRMLMTTYGLTDSEVEITQALYKNQNLSLIAEKRGRSIRTVRTQLSCVFEKTGATSQTELVGMISNLGQILDLGKDNNKSPLPHRNRTHKPDIVIRKCKSEQGHDLSYAVFGDPDGQTVLSIQPTVPPEMTPQFRSAVYESGLRFIVPYKPGSGQTSSRNYTYTPEIAARDIHAIFEAEKLKTIDILGLNSGGVYALKLAETYPKTIKKIVLCDTGVPLKSMADFAKMSNVARRTFLPARYFPALLLAPHKMVAKEFHKSEMGQQKIVHYFLDGSPSDKCLVKKDKQYYDITRDILRYSFEDVKQLVDNVCLWASDWEDLLNAVLETHNIQFLHGENHDVFRWNAVQNLAHKHPNVSAEMMQGEAQLGIFTQSHTLLNILKKKPDTSHYRHGN